MRSSGPIPVTPNWEPASPARTRRSIVPLVVLLLTLFTAGAESTRGQSNDEEYRVKAAFLFHFAQLVDWPAEARSGSDNSLSLCTLGEDPFQGTLEGTVAGKAIGDRTIRVRHLLNAQDLPACQIIFLGREQSKRISTLVTDLHNAPILTVGETAGFLDAGGMICFLLEENKVRFEINLNAADSANLKIGSRLLILAQRVMGESHGR
jgi:YfiR/HmsC-like